MPSTPQERNLLLIASFEFLKGFLLFGIALGMLGFLHKDLQGVLEQGIRMLHFDPEGHHAGALLAKAGLMNDKKIEELSALTFFYSAIHLTQAVGLWLNKKWAKYFTVAITASFIPVEIYAMVAHFKVIKLLLLGFNAVIIWFLLGMLRREKFAAYYYRPTVLFQ